MSEQNATMLENAPEISPNLKCKIYKGKLHSITSGKAYIAEQDPIGDDYVETTVLQQTKQGHWVAMRTTHPKNEDVSKLFTRVRVSENNLQMQFIPFYIALFVFGILYAWLIKVTAIDQRPLIIERGQVFNMALITLIFIMAEGFVIYHIFTAVMDFSYFRGNEGPKTRTFVLRKEDKPHSITAMEFRGQFFAIDDKTNIDRMFGPGAGAWEDSIVTENDIPYADAISQLQIDKYDLQYELHDKYQLVVHFRRKVNTLDLANLKDMTEKEFDKYNSELASVKEELQEQEKAYANAKEVITPQIDEIDEKIVILQKEYEEKLQDLVKEKLTDDRKQQITNADELIDHLKFQLSKSKIQNIRLNRTIAGQYDESMAAALDAEERAIHMSLYEYRNRRQIETDIESRNGNVPIGGGYSGSTNFDSNFSMNMDLGKILELVIKVAAIIVAFVLILNLFNKLLENAAKITWPAAIFMIVLFVVIITIWAWTSNKFGRARNYAQHSSTIDYQGRP